MTLPRNTVRIRRMKTVNDQLSVVIAGDICTTAKMNEVDGEFAKRLLRDMMPYLRAADFRIANQECVLREGDEGAPIVKSGPCLFGRVKNAELLKEAEVDCAILANNHFGDYGAPAIETTLRVLSEMGIATVGGGRNMEEAYRAYTVEKNGITVSFLAVCENEFGGAKKDAPGSAGYRLKLLSDRIREEKERADFVTVIFHGGNENIPVPSPSAQDRYRLIIDLGADALVAMHSHCMQGFETYRNCPILYELGNWFFPSRFGHSADSPWYSGYLAHLTFEKGKPVTYTVTPYHLVEDSTRFEVPTGEKKEAVLRYLDRISAPLADEDWLWRLHYGWCLKSGKGYAQALVYDPVFASDGLSAEDAARLAALKNLFGCEAHNALMRNLLFMEHEGTCAEHEKDLEELLSLCPVPRS